jgi:NADH-ubiquinone oxidoreductase chain 4L
MTWSLILFLIGLIGFILNRKNVILMLVSIEIMLLSITLIILISSISFNDNIGQLFALFIIALAGAESAIGLSILVVFYKLTGAISLTNNVNSASSNTIQNNNSNNNY